MERRLDFGEITEYRETGEGFLDLFITVSRVGDLHYQNADGSISTETLTKEELFSEKSLATLTGKPITLEHPDVWVTSDNARAFTRGATGTKVIQKEDTVQVVGSIHDKELIDLIKTGQVRQVSAGYTTDVVKRDGKLWQEKRAYNHIAILRGAGRAGDSVRVHYHDSEEVLVQTLNTDGNKKDDKTDTSNNPIDESQVVKIVENALSKLTNKIDNLTRTVDEALKSKPEANPPDNSGEQPSLSKQNSDSETNLDKIRVDAYNQGKQRASLELEASSYLKDFKFDKATDEDVQRAVIAAIRPTSKLDGKDKYQINALYELVVEEEKNKDSTVELRNAAASKKENAAKIDPEEAARLAYILRLTSGAKK